MTYKNGLVWTTNKDSEYPVATTTIADLEVTIIKYDEDSFVLTSGDNVREINLSQLDKMLVEDTIAWTQEVNNTPAVLEIPDAIKNWGGIDFWKEAAGSDIMMIEIPHSDIPGGTLRIIKLDEDSFKVAVIGIAPNDGETIRYEELDLKTTLMNYSYALGLGISISEEYYAKMKSEAEHTDYETIEE